MKVLVAFKIFNKYVIDIKIMEPMFIRNIQNHRTPMDKQVMH